MYTDSQQFIDNIVMDIRNEKSNVFNIKVAKPIGYCIKIWIPEQ